MLHPLPFRKRSPYCRPWVLRGPVIFPVCFLPPSPSSSPCPLLWTEDQSALSVRGSAQSCTRLSFPRAPHSGHCHFPGMLSAQPPDCPLVSWAAGGGVAARGPASGPWHRPPTHCHPSAHFQRFCTASLRFPSLGSSRRSTRSASTFWNKSTCCSLEALVSLTRSRPVRALRCRRGPNSLGLHRAWAGSSSWS